MVYAYQDRSLSTDWLASIKFSWRKIKKLYPLHIVMMILAIPYEIHRSGISGATLLKAISSILLIESWIPTFEYYGSFNGVAWYLSATAFLYFMYPFIQNLQKKYKSNASAIYAMTLTYIIMIAVTFFNRNAFIVSDYPDNCYWLAYTFPLLRLGDFFIGSNLGYLFINSKRPADKDANKTIIVVAQIVTLIICLFSAKIYTSPNFLLGEPWCKYTILWIPSSVMLVYLFARQDGVFAVLSNNRILQYIGDVSPYTFLVHEMNVIYIMLIADKYIKASFVTSGVTWYLYLLLLAVVAFVATIIETKIWLKFVQDKVSFPKFLS